jgi:hypothetical protein
LWFEGEFGHASAFGGEGALVIQCAQIVEKLQGTHHGFWSWRVHEVEVDQIVDAQFFEVEDCAGQIRPQNFRIVVLDEFFIVRLLSVEAEALAGSGSSRSSGPLFGAGFADGRDEETFDSHARVEHLLFGEARVDDIDDSVNSDGGLRDVCGHDDFAALYALLVGLRWGLEDALLLVGR